MTFQKTSNEIFYVERPVNDQGIIFQRKKDEQKCLVGRDGYHLLQPFQCDLCWLRNLKDKNPVGGDRVDDRFMAFIRKVNSDLL